MVILKYFIGTKQECEEVKSIIETALNIQYPCELADIINIPETSEYVIGLRDYQLSYLSSDQMTQIFDTCVINEE